MTDVQTAHQTSDDAITATYDAVIVGAGFAGMYMLHKLRGLGFTARVYDAAGGVGGTWYWNRYPGARCDVKSIDYSFSFDPELEQEWEWSEKYATQPEILRYANHIADRYELWPDMQFDTRIEASALRTASRWIVRTNQGDVVVGPARDHGGRHALHAEAARDAGHRHVPGRDVPDPKWPHEGVDFTGKRVAVIGTGLVGHPVDPADRRRRPPTLTVFQRTPNFSMPAGNRPLDDERDRQASRPTTAPTARRPRSRSSACRSHGEPVLGLRRDRGGAPGDLPGRLGRRQPGRPDRRLQRHPVRQGGQRHRRRVHPRQDPRRRQRPRGRRDAVPARTTRSARSGRASTRATTRRSTGRTSTSSTCARRRSPRSRRRASARPPASDRVRRHRVRHRLRRHDRLARRRGRAGRRRGAR